jgi:hypothetical protein
MHGDGIVISPTGASADREYRVGQKLRPPTERRLNAVQDASPALQLNNWQIARSFMMNPSQGFAELKQSPRNALPLLLLLAGGILVIQWYFTVVDFDWVKDRLLAVFAAKGARGAEGVQAVRFVSRGLLKWSTTVTSTLTTILILALEALYLLVIGMAARIRYSYGQWFAFACWSATPLIVGLIPQLLILEFGHVTQTDLNALQPLSLNELFFRVSAVSPWYRLSTTLSLLTLAQVWLSIVGLRVWSGRSWGFCTVYMLVPFALYFGVLALT